MNASSDTPISELWPKDPMQSLEAKLRGWLAAHQQIVLSWDCGGDETIIEGKVDEEEWEWDDPEFESLCEMLIEELQLPNAGCEFNSGGGTIELYNDHIVLNYEAKVSGMNWDEDTEEEVPFDDRTEQGRILLFN